MYYKEPKHLSKTKKLDPKVILFDFGNVLFDLDFPGCYQRFKDLLEIDWDGSNIPQNIQEANDRLERGEINEETFIWYFQQVKSSINPRDVIKCWNSLLVEMPSHRFEFLLNLRKDYTVALLSNINSIHISWIHRYFKEKYNLTDFEERYFDQVFYSHEIGMRKPEERVYNYVTERLGVKPNEILFVDDNEDNIEAAKKYGWRAALHDPSSDIVFKVAKYLRS